MARPTDKQYQDDDDRTATFRIPHGKLVAFQEICSSNGMNLSSVLNKIVDGVISAGGFSWESKPSPDTVNIQNEIRKAITPLIARIEALEKGEVNCEMNYGGYDTETNAQLKETDLNADIPMKHETSSCKFKFSENSDPDPNPPVDESPAQNEQIPEILGQKPDISESTEDFSQKTIEEVLNSRGDAPPEPWINNRSFVVTCEEEARFFCGQLTDPMVVAIALEFSYEDFEEYSVLEKFKKEVETVQCLNGNLYRWIGEKVVLD
jgi:hypothetical protein